MYSEIKLWDLGSQINKKEGECLLLRSLVLDKTKILLSRMTDETLILLHEAVDEVYLS